MAPNDYLPQGHRGLRKRMGSHIATRASTVAQNAAMAGWGPFLKCGLRRVVMPASGFTVMAMGLLPTLAFSDPHRDPHWAGRGWIPLDRIASIRPPVSSGGTPTDVRGQP
jgi:hypothetical protein